VNASHLAQLDRTEHVRDVDAIELRVALNRSLFEVQACLFVEPLPRLLAKRLLSVTVAGVPYWLRHFLT
jgi:hypothetical protein